MYHSVITICVILYRFVGKEGRIIHLLLTKGPVAVAVDATMWRNYVGGVIQFHCERKINHAVNVVGYDFSGRLKLSSQMLFSFCFAGCIY